MSRSKLSPEQIAYLKTLAGDGSLTPSDLVDAASDPENPFHNSFEWDDGKAGLEYRIWQARQIIKSYRITVRIKSRTVVMKAFVHDPNAGNEQGYVHVENISHRPTDVRAAITTRLRRIRSELEDIVSLAELSKLQVPDLRDALTLIDGQLKTFAPKAKKGGKGKSKASGEARPTT